MSPIEFTDTLLGSILPPPAEPPTPVEPSTPPEPQSLEGITPNTPDYWRKTVYNWGLQQWGTPEAADIFTSQLSLESMGFNLDVVWGRKRGVQGEIGIAQFMPGTAAGLGIDPWNPNSAIPASAAFMTTQLNKYSGDWRKALAAYNAGGARVNEAIELGGENWFARLPDVKVGGFTPEAGRSVQGYVTKILSGAKRPAPVGPPTGPFADFPGYYPGYQDDFTKAQVEYAAAKQAAEDWQKTTAPAIMAKSPSQFESPEWERGAGLMGIINLLLGRRPQELSDEYRQASDVVTQNVIRTGARLNLLRGLPAAMSNRTITTEDQMLDLFNSTGVMTEEDIAWSKQLFQQLQPLIPREIPLTRTELMAALSKPPRASPVVMGRLTDVDLIMALTRPATIANPGGLTLDEKMALLKSSGLNDQEAQDAIDNMSEDIDGWITSWQDINESYLLYKHHMATARIPDLTLVQKLQLALSQPWLVITKGMEVYEKYIIKPRAAIATGLVPETEYTSPFSKVLMSLPGAAKPEKLREEYQKALVEGENPYLAAGTAWERADVGAITKFITETAVDPLMYADIVLGMLAKSAKVARIPILGKFIVGTYDLWVSASNAAFNVVVWPIRRPFQTTFGKALTISRQVVLDTLSATSQRFSIRMDSSVLPRAEIAATLKEAAAHWAEKPPGSIPSGSFERLGQALNTTKLVEAEELKAWALELGQPDFQPTRNSILKVNAALERVTNAGDKGLIKVSQAADELLDAVGAVTNETNLLKANARIKERLALPIATVENLTRGDGETILRRTQGYIRDLVVNNMDSKVQIIRSEQKVLGAILNGTDFFTRNIWRDFIEKQLVAPISTMYLAIAMYGPMNLLETVGRALFDKGGIRFDEGATALARRWGGDLSSLPYDVVSGVRRAEVAIPSLERGQLGRYRPVAPLRTETEPILMRIPGIGKNILPAGTIKRLTGWDAPNISLQAWNDVFARLQTPIRHFSLANWYMSRLTEANPVEIAAIRKAIPEFHNSGITSMTGEQLKVLREFAIEEGIVSPERLAKVADTVNLLDSKIATQEVANIIHRDTVLSLEVKDTVLREAETGRMWHSLETINSIFDDALAQTDTMNITRLEIARIKYNELREQVANLTMDTEDDLLVFIKNIRDMVTLPREMAKVSRQSTQSRARRIINFEERAAWHESSSQYITSFASDASEAMREAIKVIRRSVPQFRGKVGKLSAQDLDNLISLSDRMEAIALADRNAILEERKLFSDRLPTKPRGGQANVDWWESISAARDNVWESRDKIVEFIWQDMEELSNAVSKARLPKPKPIQDKATVADVAYLFGVTGDDVSRGMFRPGLQALIGKDSFMLWVRTRANVIGKPLRLTADKMGFTRDNLSEVYDTIIRGLNIDPTTVKLSTPQYMALESMRRDFHAIYETRHIPLGDKAKLIDLIDQGVENLKQLPMFTEPITPRDVVSRYPEWLSSQVKSIGTVAKPQDVSFGFKSGDLKILPGADVESQIAHELGHVAYRKAGIADEFSKLISGRVHATRQDELFAEAFEEAVTGKPMKLSPELGFTIRSMNPEIVDDAVGFIRESIPGLPTGTVPIIGAGREAWHQARETAMQEARTRYGMTFTDYSPGTVVDAVGHGLFPFWTYESQRYAYLARLFLRHPATLTGMSRWYKDTDQGRVRIPGTSLEFSPFSGTVMMGAFRGLYLRDYPDYNDNFPGLTDFFSGAGRYGFYVGAQFSFPMAVFGAASGRADWGAVVPSWVKTPIDAYIWARPNSDLAKILRDYIMPDRMREILAIRVLGTMGVNGYDIYRKIKTNIPLTEEEVNLWDTAMGRASGYNAIMEQGFPIRLTPQEQLEAWESVDKLREEITGVPIELQHWIRDTQGITGKSFNDYFPLDPTQQVVLNELDAFKLWSGASTPLQPSRLQQKMFTIEEYWDERAKIREQTRTGFYDKTGKLVKEGRQQLEDRVKAWYQGREGGISIDQYLTMLADINRYMSGRIEELSSQDRFRDVPLTLDERKKWYEENRGVQPVWHPAKELQWLYYELEPKQVWSEESQTMEWDFDTYYATVNYLLDAIPQPYKEKFKVMVTSEMTELQKLHWDISNRYLQGYRNMRDAELERYTTEQRSIIERFSRAGALERDQLREIKVDGELKLISTFTRNLTTARKNIRTLHPELNAWLTFWRSSTDLLTPQAEQLYRELQDEYLGR